MPSQLLYQGQGRYLPPNPYTLLIFPWVQLKNLLQVIYNWLARMIWAELWRGETPNSEWVNLVAFIAFCALAWGVYWVQNYASIIFILSFLIWSLDWGLAIASYSQPQNRIALKLVQTDEQALRWQNQSPHFPLNQVKINLNKLKNLSLERISILGGAFEHSLSQPWQLSLALKDGSSYFLDQRLDLSILLPKAQHLAAQLQIPLIFADSYGNGNYAAYPLEQFAIAPSPASKSVLLQKSQQKWQVKTQWGWRNSWWLLRQILRESGFLLFLIFLANYMVKFGEFIQVAIAMVQGQTQVISGDILASLKPSFDFGDSIEVGLVIGIILYNGWRLSQIKRVTVDRICVNYFINQTLIYPLPTAQINALLLLHAQDPELIAIASDKAISLGQFQQPSVGLDFLQALTEAIAHFRHDFEPQQVPMKKTERKGS